MSPGRFESGNRLVSAAGRICVAVLALLLLGSATTWCETGKLNEAIHARTKEYIDALGVEGIV